MEIESELISRTAVEMAEIAQKDLLLPIPQLEAALLAGSVLLLATGCCHEIVLRMQSENREATRQAPQFCARGHILQ